MLRMTRHKHTHTGLVTPQLPQLLLIAVLRVLAMLVSSVSSTLQMIIRRPPVNATQAMPADLPRETSDTIQETNTAAQHRSPIALILRDREAIVSKDEGVLTILSHNHNGSGPPVRAPREGGDPVLLKNKARNLSAEAQRAQAEAPRIPSRHSGFPPARETRRLGLKT